MSDPFATSWTVASQAAPESMRFPRQESGKMGSHFLLKGIFLDPGIEPRSPALIGRQILYC